MNRKSFLVGILATGCFIATSMLMASVANAQTDPKVEKAMALASAAAFRFAPVGANHSLVPRQI